MKYTGRMSDQQRRTRAVCILDASELCRSHRGIMATRNLRANALKYTPKFVTKYRVFKGHHFVIKNSARANMLQRRKVFCNIT